LKRRTTLKDIARELKVHHTTVSRGLHDHPAVNSMTKAAIKSMAEKLNYYPNKIARQLKQNISNVIGVIVPEIKHHFFANVISGIEDASYEKDYVIMVCQSNEQYDREVMNTRALISNNVAGLLVSLSQETDNLVHFEEYIKTGGRLVLFDRISDNINANKVVVDDFNGAYLATKHLIERGKRRIAHIAGTKILSITQRRLNGYKAALQEFKIKYNPDLVVYSGFHEINGITAMQNLLNLKIPPDAVFAVNDPVAIGTYDVIKSRGLRIPEDISVVGFSNNPTSSLVQPSLTTIEQPSFEIGRRAVEILINELQCQNSQFEPITEILETKLIIRDSS
jgi:DNA-binding LacI/PurR family transcriptional regulator